MAAAAASGRAAVGPLLAFADPHLEAAFVASFSAARLSGDLLHQSAVVMLNVLTLVWKLAPRRRWAACALVGLEALVAAGLVLWHRRRPQSYLRHRSAALAAMCVAHALVRRAAGAGNGPAAGLPCAVPWLAQLMPQLPRPSH